MKDNICRTETFTLMIVPSILQNNIAKLTCMFFEMMYEEVISFEFLVTFTTTVHRVEGI